MKISLNFFSIVILMAICLNQGFTQALLEKKPKGPLLDSTLFDFKDKIIFRSAFSQKYLDIKKGQDLNALADRFPLEFQNKTLSNNDVFYQKPAWNNKYTSERDSWSYKPKKLGFLEGFLWTLFGVQTK